MAGDDDEWRARQAGGWGDGSGDGLAVVGDDGLLWPQPGDGGGSEA